MNMLNQQKRLSRPNISAGGGYLRLRLKGSHKSSCIALITIPILAILAIPILSFIHNTTNQAEATGGAIVATSISPSQGPTTGGTEITITGTNLNSTPDETDYIQNGLQLHLDAANNTGTGHSNSATTWKNLVPGGQDCTLLGGTWSDNYLRLDSNNTDYVRCGIYNYATPTWEVVTKSLMPVGSSSVYVMANIHNGGNTIGLWNGATNMRSTFFVDGATRYLDSTFDGSIALNKYLTISSRYDEAQQSLAINGEWWRRNQAGAIVYSSLTTPVAFGVNPSPTGIDGTASFNGQYCSARIYDRPLTDDEILHNQVVDYYLCDAGEDPHTVTLSNVDGDATCDITEIASDGSYVKCVTSTHLAGPVDVTFTNGVETITRADAFRYTNPTPTITSIAPNEGPIDGGTEVTITGTNFVADYIFVKVVSGDQHSLAIDSDGDLWAWGYNSNGQVGNGAAGGNVASPWQINGGAGSGIPESTKFKAITCGDQSSMAIDMEGNLYTWGVNNYHQIGNGDSTDNVLSPWRMNGAIESGIDANTKFKDVAVGNAQAVAIDEQGNLYAWGNNAHGQVGNGATASVVTTPWQINGNMGSSVSADTRFQSIAAGDNFSFAIDTEKNLYAWGSDGSGQIGNGSTTGNIANLWKINGGTNSGIDSSVKFKAVAAGDNHAMAIDTNGNLYAWGRDNEGQIGNGAATGNVLAPWQVNGGTNSGISSDTRFKALGGGGGFHSIAIDEQGNLYTWGDNATGSIGDGGPVGGIVTSPWQVNGGSGSGVDVDTKFAAAAGGFRHSIAISANGELYAWGQNTYGQMGNGTQVGNFSSPLNITAFFPQKSNITSIALGGASCENVTIVSSTELTCTTAAHIAGAVDVVMTDNDNKTSTLYNAFNYRDPMEITSITPDNGLTTGGTVITIAGANFNNEPNFTDYIQNGLQLHLDAANNTGTGHSNSATTWKNLVPGGEDCEVIGGTWSDKYIELNGTNAQYVRCGLYNYTYPTWEVATKSLMSTSGSGMGHILANVQNGGITISSSNGGVFFSPAYINGDYRYLYSTIDSTTALGKYVTMSTKLDGTQQSLSINGDWWHQDQAGVLTYDPVTPVILGGNPNTAGVPSGSIYKGQICSARIYDRPLTDDEILHNQVVDYYLCDAGEDPRTVTLGSGPTAAPCEVTSWTDTAITCTATAHVAGLVEVSVSNGIETAALPAVWTDTGTGTSTNQTIGNIASGFLYEEPFLNINSSGDINLSITPQTNGSISANSHTVTTTTNIPTGFKLSLSTTTTNNNLAGANSNAITSTAGTMLAPATLSTNTWGFALPSSQSDLSPNGFDSAYTSQNNTPAPSYTATWAAVPTTSTGPLLLKTTSTLNRTGDTTTIFYGANVDFTKPAGTYVGTVLYTVVGNY